MPATSRYVPVARWEAHHCCPSGSYPLEPIPSAPRLFLSLPQGKHPLLRTAQAFHLHGVSRCPSSPPPSPTTSADRSCLSSPCHVYRPGRHVRKCTRHAA